MTCRRHTYLIGIHTTVQTQGICNVSKTLKICTLNSPHKTPVRVERIIIGPCGASVAVWGGERLTV